MDEVTCRIVRPKTLSYQSTIEKSIHKEKITTIFEPNTFKDAEFYIWDDTKSLNENSKNFKNHKKNVRVCLTRVSPEDQDKEAKGSSLPKYHISIYKITPDNYNSNNPEKKPKEKNDDEKNPITTEQVNFLNFLINKDYMVNPTFVEITESMGSPYHITLKVDK